MLAHELICAQIEPSFRIFERFKSWEKEYKVNSLTDNTTVCCELIEANASLQHELFKILRLFVTQGSLCTESNKVFPEAFVEETIKKSYLSPALISENNFHQNQRDLHSCTNIHPTAKDYRDKLDYSKSLPSLENEILERLIQSQIQCDRLTNQLKAQSMEFIQPNIENKSIYSTQKRPRAMVDTESIVASPVSEYDLNKPVNERCDDDIYPQDSDNSFISNDHLVKFVEDKNVTSHLQSWLSPLVSRYNDLFTNLRVSCMDYLQSLGQSDCARNQRLIFHAVQAGFTVTSHVIHRLPSCTQKENYVSRNVGERQFSASDISLNADQLDKLVAATFRRLSRHAPPECACHTSITSMCGTNIKRPISIRRPVTSQELTALDNLLKEVCCLAWHLLAGKKSPQLDIESDGIQSTWYADVDKAAKPGDPYNDKCYRRSYDSDPSAGQVHHYIWPCLILYSQRPTEIQQRFQSTKMDKTNRCKSVKACILVKGEACTRNPIYAASQKDKAAALLNHEYSCQNVCRCTSPQKYGRSRSASIRRV
ncbi:unnamed protein product [Schistosoma mattheei]|uniref:Mitochondria-eating protein n=1 Tax=Schistosoma mattheei TaxID=31246 RepID=A0AA85BVA9_9TREM|nr:unnamed protein product [Schistosoma mattheei]